MKKITFLLAMMLVTFTACNNEDFEEISLESKREKISYEVTPEEAVSRLGMFLSNKGTRASLNDVTIKTLMKSDFVPTTRRSDVEDAPAVYLIDIPDGGCAIMGADKRLEPVYAIMDETKLSPEDLIATSTRTESTGEEDIQTFVTGLINDAVEADIKGIPIIKDTTELIPNPLPHHEEWYDTTYHFKVNPLLKTKWDQHAPFNENYPDHSLNVKELAGCGVIATAQLVYYNRYPSSVSGVNFNWDLISRYEYVEQPSVSADTAVANFVFTLACAVGANWNYHPEIGTTTTDSGLRNFFRNNGYPNANFYLYSLPSVNNMLNDNKPVIISGRQSDKEIGHSWIIDGCNIYRMDHWIKEYIFPVPIDGDPYNEYILETINCNLVHCNYGWGGICDGYYTSGIFDTRTVLDQMSIDPSIGDISYEGESNYDTNLRIMQY